MENLLYYPYINVPKANWTARTLLYYDNVGSIVPQRYFYHPNSYDPFMRKLVKNELIIPINPIEVLDNPWAITDPFIEYMGTEEFNLVKRVKSFQQGKRNKIHQDKFNFSGSRVHADKFSYEIFYQLEHAGLAIRKDNEWFLVEQKTAKELMSFLATVIGTKIDYRPTTDSLKFRFNYKPSNSTYEFHKKKDKTRQKILRELIPFPQEIDINKLRDFKDKNLGLLKAFKNQIELIVLDDRYENNDALLNEKIKELKLRKEELYSKLIENRFGEIIFGTVCGISGATYGFLQADTIGATIGAIPGFAHAVYSAMRIENPEKIFDQSGMKYLALVDKKLIKPVANKV